MTREPRRRPGRAKPGAGAEGLPRAGSGPRAWTWKIIRGPDVATLAISPAVPIEGEDRLALAEEGARLLAFFAHDQDMRISVRFAEE